MTFKLTNQELLNLLPAPLVKAYPPFIKNNNKNILIVGGSGFLGIHLLAELLNRNHHLNDVYLLSRNLNLEEAQSKIIKQSEKFGLAILLNWIQNNPLNFIFGDVEQEQWGLKEQYNFDQIIYTPSKMSALANLTQLWKSNVEPILNLSSNLSFRNFIYISSLSVFVSSSHIGICQENDSLHSDREYYGGYAQSKFLCERILQIKSQNHQSKFIIVRPGLLTGNTFNFKFPEHDFFSHFILSLKKLGCFPSSIPLETVDISPVNQVAAKIIDLLTIHHLFRSNNFINYHIANQKSIALKTIIELCNKKSPMLCVSNEDFYTNLNSKNNPLDNFSKLLLKMAFSKKEVLDKNFKYYNFDLFQSTQWEYQLSPFLKFNDKIDIQQLIENYIKRIHEEK